MDVTKMAATANYALGDAIVNTRGAKSCTLTGKDGDKVIFTLGSQDQPTNSPFGASSYNDEATTRKTIDFRLTPEQEAEWSEFDAWAVDYLTEHSERLFKKKLERAQVSEHYRSPVSKKDPYPATLRCKINVAGKAEVRCWRFDGERATLPEDLRVSDLVPRLHLSHLWVMGRDFGFVLNVLDLCLLDGSGAVEFPF